MRVEEKISGFFGYECRDFVLDGYNCKLVIPKKADPRGRWLIKTEYFDHFPAFQLEMLSRGYHLAYVENRTRWMVPEDVEAKEKLAQYLVSEYGLNEKCVPVGISCGGLHAVYFAAKYPERIAALYIDAPVMNLLSCPAAIGRRATINISELEAGTGLTIKDLLNYRNHPIDKKEILLENKIPIIMVYGDSDSVVPYDENGKYLEEFYRANGGDIVTICKPGCEHHPHGLEDVTPIVEFVEKRYL